MLIEQNTRLTRILFSFIFLLLGLILVLLSVPEVIGLEKNAAQFISKIGLAFLVAGVVTTLQEILLKKNENEELRLMVRRELESAIKSVYDEKREHFSTEIKSVIEGIPPYCSGIKLVKEDRVHYDGYYDWVKNHEHKEVTIIGRSVLHRLEERFLAQSFGSVEHVILNKMRAGCRIKIFFIDPRLPIISDLAIEEGREEAGPLYKDLAKSISICEKIYFALENEKIPISSSLQIAIYNRAPYFAYHKDSDKSIAGFYFGNTIGENTPAFEIVDNDTKEYFESHIMQLSNQRDLKKLIYFKGGASFKNEKEFEEIKAFLKEKINETGENYEDIFPVIHPQLMPDGKY